LFFSNLSPTFKAGTGVLWHDGGRVDWGVRSVGLPSVLGESDVPGVSRAISMAEPPTYITVCRSRGAELMTDKICQRFHATCMMRTTHCSGATPRHTK